MQLLRGVLAALIMNSLSSLKKLKALGANATFLYEFDDFASRYVARVCDVVGAEGDVVSPSRRKVAATNSVKLRDAVACLE